MAIGALITGIVALVFAIIPFLFILGGLLGLVALGLGIAGLSRSKRVNQGRGQSISGIVTGALAILGTIAWIAAGAAFLASVPGIVSEIEQQASEGTVDGGLGLSCEGEATARTAEGTQQVGAFEVSDITVCADFADDFLFEATVTNPGGSEATGELQFQASDGGSTLSTGTTSTVTLAPGESQQVNATTFDDYDDSWSEVTVTGG